MCCVSAHVCAMHIPREAMAFPRQPTSFHAYILVPYILSLLVFFRASVLQLTLSLLDHQFLSLPWLNHKAQKLALSSLDIEK